MGIKLRVERDRHFHCQPGQCVAPVPSARRLQGRAPAPCRPRRSYWLRVNRNGKREAFAFQSEGDAQMALQKIRAAATLGQDYQPKGEAPAPKVPTFAVVGEQALVQHEAAESPHPATMGSHWSFFRHHLIPAFGSLPVTPEHFNSDTMKSFVLAKKQAGTLAQSTLKASLPTLRLILRFAVESKLKLLPAVPQWRVKLKGARPVDPFTASEIRAIFKAAPTIDADFAALVQVLAQTGMRPGEGLGLRRGDINLETMTAHIQGSYSHEVLGGTKNEHSVRRVSFLYPVSEDSLHWRPRDAGHSTRAVMDRLTVLVATAADPESRLWPITRDRMAKLWRRTLKSAGVRFRKPHALGHSFASLLLSRGANTLAIAKATGHKNSLTLLSVYSRWINQEDEAATTPAPMPVSDEFRSPSLLTR